MKANFMLYSKRGKKFVDTEKRRTCSNCSKQKSTVFLYNESSIGEVYICQPCKEEYFNFTKPENPFYEKVYRNYIK